MRRARSRRCRARARSPPRARPRRSRTASSPSSAAARSASPPTDRRAQPIAVRNPMSAEQAVMRTSLLPNLIAAIARNQSYGRPDVCAVRGRQRVPAPRRRRRRATAARARRRAARGPPACSPASAARQLGARHAVGRVRREGARARGDPRGRRRRRRRASTATRDVPYLHPGVAGELVIDDDDAARRRLVRRAPSRTCASALGVDRRRVRVRGRARRAAGRAAGADARDPAVPGHRRATSRCCSPRRSRRRASQAVIAAAPSRWSPAIRLLEDYRDAEARRRHEVACCGRSRIAPPIAR